MSEIVLFNRLHEYEVKITLDPGNVKDMDLINPEKWKITLEVALKSVVEQLKSVEIRANQKNSVVDLYFAVGFDDYYEVQKYTFYKQSRIFNGYSGIAEALGRAGDQILKIAHDECFLPSENAIPPAEKQVSTEGIPHFPKQKNGGYGGSLLN